MLDRNDVVDLGGFGLAAWESDLAEVVVPVEDMLSQAGGPSVLGVGHFDGGF